MAIKKQQLLRVLQQLYRFLIALKIKFTRDRCFRVASALSFTTLLAIVPLVTVVFSMLSLFPVFEEGSISAETFLFNNFVPAAGEVIRDNLHTFSQKAGELTLFGLVFLMVSSLLMLATIEDAFNDIWRVRRGRVFFQRLLVYWAVLTLGPILIIASLSMSSTLLSMVFFMKESLIVDATTVLLRYLPILFELVAYILFYTAIPYTEVKFRHALAGAVVATILFELAKMGFVFYIINFRSYELIYGAISTIPIFIVWVYLSWLVMLVGAEVAALMKNGLITSESP